MASSVTIISPTTNAVTQQVPQRINTVPATISATNLAGAETVTVYWSVDNGVTWEQLYLNGTAVQLDGTNKAISIYSPMLLGFLKTASVGTVGVYQN